VPAKVALSKLPDGKSDSFCKLKHVSQSVTMLLEDLGSLPTTIFCTEEKAFSTSS